MEPTLKDAVLTPDGNIWICCDFVDLSYHEIEDDNFTQIQNPIIGNMKESSLDVILDRKKRHSIKVKSMRFKDATEGKLQNGREIMCENCKFYHFHKII